MKGYLPVRIAASQTDAGVMGTEDEGQLFGFVAANVGAAAGTVTLKSKGAVFQTIKVPVGDSVPFAIEKGVEVGALTVTTDANAEVTCYIKKKRA